jgi:signal transduction histidine kinase
METRRTFGPLNRGGWERLVVTVGLAGFVAGIYVTVVLGGGALIGRTDSPSLPLSVLATASVALLFAPVQSALERIARSRRPGGGATPYEVLSRFSETVTGGYPTEELPGRMAMLLAQGTGAAWTQVWLAVSDRLTLAATWPPDADQDLSPPSPELDLDPGGAAATGEGRRILTVRHAGQLLGVLRLQERPGLTLTAVEERLFAGLAAQAGLVLRLAGLRAELGGRHEELVVRADELQASRVRLIETQDAERRRLERDIHDGAQQHLVALTVNLRLAMTIGAHSPERATDVLARQVEPARVAIETLTSLSRGIYPSVLSDDGLVAALRCAVGSSAIPVAIEAEDLARLPASVEAALYFCCMEAVQNAAKHSGAGTVTVRLGEDGRRWRLVVADDGTGFDQARARADGGGAGLMNMRDRLDAVGGTVALGSRVGEGTTVTAVVPMTRGG